MEKLNWYAVINGKISPKKRKVINQILEDYHIKSFTTTSQGQASELLVKTKEYDGIISIGGDGTFHEVINGSNLDRQKILVVPGGTINCFSRFLKIRKLEQGMELVEKGEMQNWICYRLEFNSKMVQVRVESYGDS
jgi:diacylglycerol kinase family enzyme